MFLRCTSYVPSKKKKSCKCSHQFIQHVPYHWHILVSNPALKRWLELVLWGFHAKPYLLIYNRRWVHTFFFSSCYLPFLVMAFEYQVRAERFIFSGEGFMRCSIKYIDRPCSWLCGDNVRIVVLVSCPIDFSIVDDFLYDLDMCVVVAPIPTDF